MDLAIVQRLAVARNILEKECVYPGSTFGSEDADSAWEELSLAVDVILSEYENPGGNSSRNSFRQELVKEIAPSVVRHALDKSNNFDSMDEVVVFAKLMTNQIVDSLIEASKGE